ncbi:PEP/pyruvate-binding domain-containing protein [Magnetospirillum sp. 64-120]|uniref:PEP/pyruvate-binding domain-containing protein n=1 Tax=Magnetospirillum sp. 64-120 TaxID=1895778 RepID=UPI00092A5B3C|nr:PEP/pyruvate-binding domain-containing protein [Magnetospirillum sp. 64-120]OJX75188.1 MAG: hypothetical protein BGO92_00255 [Magnetospirillum sp. 64-120]
MSTPLFLDWHQAALSTAADIGGKADGLVQLHRFGFRVPAGGVLNVAACDLLDVDPEAVLRLLEEGLTRLGLGDTPLAVRSSAVGEDGRHASFAGIHQSCLNVRGRAGLLAALRRCRDSGFSDSAQAYRRHLGLDGRPRMALIVMAMAPTLAAGVAFSCDPRDGREDRVFIAANDGLGESVVGGLCDPDEMVVQVGLHAPTAHVAERRLGRKEKVCEPRPEGGTSLRDTDGAPHQALPDQACLHLARLVVRIRDSLGDFEIHQDVEWSWDGQDFWLLQARPVTTLPRYLPPPVAELPDVWSNGNFRDSMPMPFLPLAWSVAQHAINTILEASQQAGGVTVLPGMVRAKLIEGRGYFRINAMMWDFWHGFGFPPSVTNRLLGGHQGETSPTPPQGWRHRWRRLAANLRMGKAISQAQKQAPDLFAQLTEKTESLRHRDLRTMTDAELIRQFRQLDLDYCANRPLHLLQSAAAGSYLMLSALIGRFVPGQGESLAQALLADAAQITSANHGRDLAVLARQARTEPQAAMIVRQGGDWRTLPADSAFRQGLERFLTLYGHRAVYELDISNPRWREDQSWLLSTMACMLDHDGLDEMDLRRLRLRQDAEQRVRQALPWPLSRLALKLAAKAGNEAALREMAKSCMVRIADVKRHLALELGRRLTGQSLLGDTTDVFYLTLDDLDDLVSGLWRGPGIGRLVEARRTSHARRLTEAPPDVVIEGQPTPHKPAPHATGHSGWSGLGVAAGQATGAACLMTSPTEGDRLAPGQVLVAPSTDPGWTPLFLRIGALVTETGGFISHGAIVAREFGIPAVVNVPGIMGTLAPGAMLRVDGDNGTVEVVARTPAG